MDKMIIERDIILSPEHQYRKSQLFQKALNAPKNADGDVMACEIDQEYDALFKEVFVEVCGCMAG